MLAYGVRWATGDYESPDGWRRPPLPKHYDDFAAYAGAFAARYGRNGSFWAAYPWLPYHPVRSYEIWNETNWRDNAAFDPVEYGDFYARVQAAIEAVDPAARTPFGALAWTNAESWLQRAFEGHPGLRESVDEVSVHLYGHWTEIAKQRLRDFRAWIDRYGDPSMRIDVTEDGVAVGPDLDDWRADYLAEMTASMANSGCGVKTYIPHTWWTAESNPGDTEDWFGIAAGDGSLHSSGEAFTLTSQLMRGLLPGNMLSDLDDLLGGLLGNLGDILTGSNDPEPICTSTAPDPVPEPDPDPDPDPTMPVPAEPQAELILKPRVGSDSTSVRFKIKAPSDTGPIKKRRYKLDNRDWRKTGKTLVLKNLSPGRHQLKVKATTRHGEKLSARYKWHVERP